MSAENTPQPMQYGRHHDTMVKTEIWCFCNLALSGSIPPREIDHIATTLYKEDVTPDIVHLLNSDDYRITGIPRWVGALLKRHADTLRASRRRPDDRRPGSPPALQ